MNKYVENPPRWMAESRGENKRDVQSHSNKLSRAELRGNQRLSSQAGSDQVVLLIIPLLINCGSFPALSVDRSNSALANSLA